MKKRWLATLLALAFCCGLFAGCSKEEPQGPDEQQSGQQQDGEQDKQQEPKDDKPAENGVKEGGTFVVSVAREPATYNPDAVSDDGNLPVVHNVFNKLVKINGSDQVVPDLAESWEFSEDGTSVTFHLHENVKWHDGEPFTAEDVKWTIEQIQSAEGFAAGSLADIVEITCPDANTVEMKLAGPNSGIVSSLAWNGTFIMPKHLYEGTDWLENETNQSPVGTGPFKFVEHKAGQSVTLEKNADFWGEKPHLDKVIITIIPDQNTAYQAWLNGEVDELRNGVPANELSKYENNSDYVVYDKLWPNRGYLLFNVNEGPFADLKVRQAVAYGIDRDEINEKALKNQGMKAEYFISPLFDWALDRNIKLPERDVEKAKQLLEEAGYTADENGIYFTTTIDHFPGFEDVVEVVKANFKEIGIELEINSMDDASYDDKVWFGHDFEITILGGYQGPDISAIANRFGENGSINLGEYKNGRLNELFAEGVVKSTPEDRAVVYKEVQKILSEDLPAVFYNEKGTKIVTKAYVKGHPAGEVSDKASEVEFTYVWLDK